MSTKLVELEKEFDLNELERQLQSVIESKDPIGYMSSNINWEIDKDLDEHPGLTKISLLMADQPLYMNYSNWNPIRRFLNWFQRNKVARKIKRILCEIADQIKKLIDEEAELKKILSVGLLAIIAALGIGSINPVLLTLLVGILATMILKGVESVCAI